SRSRNRQCLARCSYIDIVSKNPRFFKPQVVSKTVRFVRLQRDQRLTLWYIGKSKQGVLRNHAIPQCTFLTPVGNRCITPCVCVKERSRSRGVIPTAGGLSVHTGTVFCRNIRRNIQRYWILRRICRSLSCSASEERRELRLHRGEKPR